MCSKAGLQAAIRRDRGAVVAADDRLRLVYALGGATRRHLIAAAVWHAARVRRTLADPPFLAIDDLWLHTGPPLPLDVDGEIRDHTTALLALAPEALRVMVAADFPDT